MPATNAGRGTLDFCWAGASRRLRSAGPTNARVPPSQAPGASELGAGETPGVSALKTMADALRIRGELSGARHAVILGGGLICLLTIHALLKVGVSVTIAVSSDRLLTRMLDEEAAAILTGGPS